MKRKPTSHLFPILIKLNPQGSLVLFEIDQLIAVLKDGEWHPIDEVIEKCGLSTSEAQSVIEFLKRYEFIEIDIDSQKVRIASSLQRFLLKV